MEELLEKLERQKDSHKGQNGKVAVIGGSVDYTGAPALAAEAALRSGADLVKVLTSAEARDVIRSYSENLIVESYESNYFGEEAVKNAERIAGWSDAVLIGPGMSHPGSVATKKLAESIDTPMVADADAIAPSSHADFGEAVFTPHSGEKGEIGVEYGSIRKFVEGKETNVLRKGRKDLIYTPEKIYENEKGHETMTVGGTGDVLSGLVASLIAQGLEPAEAARLGAWVNGMAGERAAQKYGNGALATDLIEEIPDMISQQT